MKGTIARKQAGFEMTWPAAADLSDYQYRFMKADSNGRVNIIAAVDDIVVGVLDNDPAALDRGARIIHSGVCKLVTDGSSTAITRGNWLASNATGKGVKSKSNMAVAMALNPSSADGTIISALLMLHPMRVQDDHLELMADQEAKKQVRIGSKVATITSDTHMGFSSKPDLEGDGSATVTGCEISPRISNGGSGANLYGIDVNLDIKSDASSAVLSSNMVALKCKLECASALVTTITGEACCLRCEPALSGNQTVTGKYVPISIRDATQQGVGKNWDGALMIGGDGSIADTSSTPSTQAGMIKVLIGTTVRYIRLYSGA